MRSGVLTAALVTAAAGLAVTAAAFARADAPAGADQATACRRPEISIEAPLAGPGAFLGQEQRRWAQLAVVNFNRRFRTTIRLNLRNTGLQDSLAVAAGRLDVLDPNVLAVVGPSTSGAVVANGDLFERRNLAAISPSATRLDLTSGRFRTFFRVVPNDGAQAPTVAAYIANTVKARHVFVVDGQEPYSNALAAQVQRLLGARRVRVTRESTDPARETTFSALVRKVRNDVRIVLLPWPFPAAAQAFSSELVRQRKRAIVFGTDGVYDPQRFRPRRGYVTTFAPDIRKLPSAQAIVRQFARRFRTSFGVFGPPSYVAAWIALDAVRRSCADRSATRAEVVRQVRTSTTRTLWNTTLRFTRRGDVRGGRFFVFRITNGRYSFVG